MKSSVAATAASAGNASVAGRYAAIDIGTVTCRLLIADVTPYGEIYEVRRDLTFTNLGLGVDARGSLDPAAIDRVVRATRDYLNIIDAYTVGLDFTSEFDPRDALDSTSVLVQTTASDSVSVLDLTNSLEPESVQGPTNSLEPESVLDPTNSLEPESAFDPTNLLAHTSWQDPTGAQHPLRGLVVFATSAARDASNADELVRALADIGVELTIIEGDAEARLSFAGASSAFAGENICVVDVGGGSTEVTLGRACQHPFATHSFNIGCRRVTEKFLTCDPPTNTQIEEARAWITHLMQSYFDDRVLPFAPERFVAVAGTATSVVSMRDKMEHYDAHRVHLSRVDRSDLDRIFDELRALTREERKQVVGLEVKRAGVIVAGLVIMQCLLDLAGAESFTVSELDILHGAIIALSRAAAL